MARGSGKEGELSTGSVSIIEKQKGGGAEAVDDGGGCGVPSERRRIRQVWYSLMESSNI